MTVRRRYAVISNGPFRGGAVAGAVHPQEDVEGPQDADLGRQGGALVRRAEDLDVGWVAVEELANAGPLMAGTAQPELLADDAVPHREQAGSLPGEELGRRHVAESVDVCARATLAAFGQDAPEPVGMPSTRDHIRLCGVEIAVGRDLGEQMRDPVRVGTEDS